MTIAKHLPEENLVRSVKRRLDRPLVLVGMMGVGKSTVGRKLALALGLRFTDADDAIVAAANMPIREIFERFGEDHFRDGERRVIARLMDTAGAGNVIATGGGAFVTPVTRALILAKAVAIWLDADTDTLVERVSRNDKRPLLTGGDTRELVARMRAERESAYAEAHLHIASDTGPHHVAVRRIIEGLDVWLG